MRMTVGELKDMLEEIDNDELEVRFGAQPSWPMEYSVEANSFSETADAVYLFEGRQIGYLSEEAREGAGW